MIQRYAPWNTTLMVEAPGGAYVLEADHQRIVGELVEALKMADKMRDWFMHTLPEWDKSTQAAIDAYDKARAALEKVSK